MDSESEPPGDTQTFSVGEFTVHLEPRTGNAWAEEAGSCMQYPCRLHSVQVRESVLEAHRRLQNSDSVSRLKTVRVHGSRLCVLYEPHFGDMHAFVRERGCLDERTASHYFKQVLQALLDAHKAGIVLRDLRLRNVVFSDPQRARVKVQNLAESVCLQDAANDLVHNTQQSCPSYISPEMLDGARTGTAYAGRASDCWFLGVILYTLLTGQYPFCDRELSVLFQRIRNAYFCVPGQISPAARSLIRALLRRNPAERLTVAQVFQHPWLSAAVPVPAFCTNAAYSDIPVSTNSNSNSTARQTTFLQANDLAKENRRLLSNSQIINSGNANSRSNLFCIVHSDSQTHAL